MGAWSTDMLGSDDALDTLGFLEDLVGLGESSVSGVCLYPFPEKDNEQDIKTIRTALENCPYKILDYKWQGESQAWPVIASAYLVTGAKMPTDIHNKAIEGCRNETIDIDKYGWSNPKERIDVLSDMIYKIEYHETGKITQIENTGLFENILGKKR